MELHKWFDRLISSGRSVSEQIREHPEHEKSQLQAQVRFETNAMGSTFIVESERRYFGPRELNTVWICTPHVE
jgi:hypothetical protein